MTERAVAPIEMLVKCRRFFADEAAVYRQTERICGSKWEKKVAGEFAAASEKFIAEIDATLKEHEMPKAGYSSVKKNLPT